MFVYLISASPKAMARETSSLQNIAKSIEQQRVIDWGNKLNMTTMTRAMF